MIKTIGGRQMKAKSVLEAIRMRSESRMTEEEFKNFLESYDESEKAARKLSKHCLDTIIQKQIPNAEIYFSFKRIFAQNEDEKDYNKCVLKIGGEDILNDLHMDAKINLGLLIRILDAEFKSYGFKRDDAQSQVMETISKGNIVSGTRIYHG